MYELKKSTDSGFNYVLEKELGANETIIIKMPKVSANKRGVNDIGWQCDGNITIYGTLSGHPEEDETLWQEINPLDEVNKTVSAVKVQNFETPCRFVMRVIMN